VSGVALCNDSCTRRSIVRALKGEGGTEARSRIEENGNGARPRAGPFPKSAFTAKFYERTGEHAPPPLLPFFGRFSRPSRNRAVVAP